MAGTVAERSELFLLVHFLLLFHVISAAVLGGAVRSFWQARGQPGASGCGLSFTAVWAALFGGIPFTFGVRLATSERGYGWLIPLQVAVWGGTFLTVLLAHGELQATLEPLRDPDMLMMLFGGGFLLVGLALLALSPGESRLGTVCAGGSLFLIGGTVFGIGLWQMLRTTR